MNALDPGSDPHSPTMRRNRTATAAAAALVILLTACGSGTSAPTSATSTTAGANTTVTTPAPDPTTTAVTDAPTSTSAEGVDPDPELAPAVAPDPNVAVALGGMSFGAIRIGTSIDAPIHFNDHTFTALDHAAAAWTGLDGVAPVACSSTDPFVVLGHRTTHGAVFRDLDLVDVGDVVHVDLADGSSCLYVIDTINVVPAGRADIALAEFATPGGILLSACSKVDGSPTSTAFRLMLTGHLDA